MTFKRYEGQLHDANDPSGIVEDVTDLSGDNYGQKCGSCGHFESDHLLGPCDYVKWIGGHPEYRCMCNKFSDME
jgi:hypothetical protein